jgi:hypothetical protein
VSLLVCGLLSGECRVLRSLLVVRRFLGVWSIVVLLSVVVGPLSVVIRLLGGSRVG